MSPQPFDVRAMTFIAALSAGACVCFPTTTDLLTSQAMTAASFSAQAWRDVAGQHRNVIERTRLPMVEALIAKLWAERPRRAAVLELLGPDEYPGAFRARDDVWLIANPEECWADFYWLVVSFDSDGEIAGIMTTCD